MANVYGTGAPTVTTPDNLSGPPLALKHGVIATVDVTVQKIRYYVTATEMFGRSVDVYVWTGAGSIAQSKTVTLPSALGWAEFTLDTPYAVAANTAFGVGIWFPTGAGNVFYGHGATQLPKTTGAITLTGGGFDESTKTAGDPTGFSGTSSYFLDVETTTTPLVVSAGADQTIDASGSTTVTATATGGSGSKTYAWTIVSGGTGTFGSASSASTTFTPSAPGTYGLRCTVTDGSGSSSDDVIVTATSRRRIATVTSSTGWTATGGTVQAVLADNSSATYVTSPNNPSGALIDGILQPITPPAAGQPFVVRLRGYKSGATSGSVTVKLYDGAALRATQVIPAIPDAEGEMTATFPSGDIALVTSWATGVRITIEATAV